MANVRLAHDDWLPSEPPHAMPDQIDGRPSSSYCQNPSAAGAGPRLVRRVVLLEVVGAELHGDMEYHVC